MPNRIVKCHVANEFIRGAGQIIGAAGSHDDVELELEFSPLWYGTAKRIVWFDALGENPVMTPLLPSMMVPETVPDETEVYRVPVPPEAKAVEGNMTLTIRGVEVADGVETRAVVAATAPFKVLPAIWDPFADESQDISPTQADQILAELEGVKEDIIAAGEAADAKEAAQEAANQAQSAKNKAESAAAEAEASAERAEESAEDSERWANKAQAEAERAAVPAVQGVYNVILTDRVTAERYALLVEDGRLALLGVANTLDAVDLNLVDTTTGTAYALVVDGGKLSIEEVA